MQTHTHTDRNIDYGGMFFSFSLLRSAQPRHLSWGTRDSECINLHCLKDSGTKIMAFQCEGHRCEMWVMLFKAPGFRRRAWSCWRWTAIVNILARSVLSVNLQSHAAELLTSRHSICAPKLSKHPQPCCWFQSSSIRCALFCIVRHENFAALATRNFKKRSSRSMSMLAKHGPKSRMLSSVECCWKRSWRRNA